MLYDYPAISLALDHLADAIRFESRQTISLIGIQRGGSVVADALQARLEHAGEQVDRGNLDISFYRDDLDTIGPHPEVHPSLIPFDINGKTLWLVDDVLYTGRTIRAALGEIFDYGRPAAVRLAVLLDRGGRELPISADAVGLRHEAPPGMSVKLVYAQSEWRIIQQRVQA
ncbi:MAG: bifunctional pyr operon transcriptional regulator/uracil phosphoribosyltransferase PyrR [Mariprofundaceae bacterium]